MTLILSRTPVSWGMQALVAAVFVALAALSLQLGVYPILSRPLWLPAGLVVALIFARGTRDMPGLILGAAIFGAWRYWESQHLASMLTNALYITAQVWLGHWLFCRFMGPLSAAGSRELITGPHIAWAAFIGGPLICTIKPLVLFPVLVALDLIPSYRLWDRGLDWIIADAAAVLLLSPVILVFVGQPQAWWRSRFHALALVQGLIVSSFAFFLQYTSKLEKESLERQFRTELDESIQHLNVEVQSYAQALHDPGGVQFLGGLPAWLALSDQPGWTAVPDVRSLYINLDAWMAAEQQLRYQSRNFQLTPLNAVAKDRVLWVDRELYGQPIALSVQDPYLRQLVSGPLRALQMAFSLAALMATAFGLLGSARRRSLELSVEERTRELKAKADELRLYQALIDQAPLPVMVSKPSTERAALSLTYCNPAFERITGHSLADFQASHQTIGSILRGEETDHEQHVRMFNELSAGQASHLSVVHYRKDGTPFWAEVNAFPISNSDGQAHHWAAFYTDASARRQEQLQSAETRQKALQHEQELNLGRMSSGIAHDFNNLLTTMQSGLELLRMEHPHLQDAETLDDLDTAIKRANELTQQLLLLAGRGVGQVRDLNLTEHLQLLTRLLRLSVPSNVELEVKVNADVQTC